MKYGWQNTGEAALQSKSMRFLGYSADVHKINLGERVCGWMVCSVKLSSGQKGFNVAKPHPLPIV